MSKTSVSAPPATRIVRVALDGTVAPGHEALLVRDDAHPFALVGRWAGGGALIGSEPVRVARPDQDPFALLAETAAPVADPNGSDATAPAPPFVGGGWFGYLGFGLGAPGEAFDAPPPTSEQLPPFALAYYDHLLRLDVRGRWWFEALWTPARADALTERLELLGARLKAGAPAPGAVSTRPWRADPSRAGHGLAVRACRERIAAGDLYQANLSLRLRSTLDGDPGDLFAEGVAALAPDRAAYLAGEWGAVASLSPELFLERRGRRVRSAPIKGTRRRPPNPEEAADARAELAGSEKDRAENVMILDLVRNDLGRVCGPGGVRVRALAQPRSAPGVWHLVSEVEGELEPDVDDAALLAATFPPGSVTGAPKLAALAAIAELESHARQAFTGAIGFVSPVAGLELSVAIRTFEVRGEEIWLDVGGGIVADSDPAAEAAEALVKARPLLEAIGAVVADDAPASPVPRPSRLGPRPLPRPDPAAGVFETIRVEEGRAPALDLHLARLAASVAALYGATLPRDLAERVAREAAAAADPCRLRVSAVPVSDAWPHGGAHGAGTRVPLPGAGQLALGAVAIEVETAPLPAPAEEIALAPVTVPGGLGAHKWRDRRMLDALAAATAPATPLLVDLDGNVLEAAWANVVVVTADGTAATPPLDGRILPGVGRAQALREGGVSERPIALHELQAAREIRVTSALRTVRSHLVPVEIEQLA